MNIIMSPMAKTCENRRVSFESGVESIREEVEDALKSIPSVFMPKPYYDSVRLLVTPSAVDSCSSAILELLFDSLGTLPFNMNIFIPIEVLVKDGVKEVNPYTFITRGEVRYEPSHVDDFGVLLDSRMDIRIEYETTA